MVIEELLPTWGLLVKLDLFSDHRFIRGVDKGRRFFEALALHCPNLTELRLAGPGKHGFDHVSLAGWELIPYDLHGDDKCLFTRVKARD